MTITDWKRDLCLILAVSMFFTFWGLGSVALLDPDEGMYGSIAREMAEGGDWVTPHFNGVRYLEKPPLYFWLTAFTTGLFGPSEWGTRLWSALPALGTALLTWRIGCLLYGPQAGLLSAIVFLTGVGVFRYSRVAATDFLLVFSLTLAMYGFVKAALSRMPAKATYKRGMVDDPLILCYLGVALAVLSKGMVGLVLPFLIIALFLYFTKSNGISSAVRLREGIYSPAGPLLFLLLVLPWHLLTAWRNNDFFGFYLVDNQFLRFLNSRAFVEDDVPVTTPAFLVLTLIWFFPWSLFLPVALRQGFPRLQSARLPAQRMHLLVGLWAATTIGFFSLSGSKLEHYFLPAVPAMSLMVGALWAQPFHSLKNINGLKRTLAVGGTGCFVAGAGLLLLSDRLSPQALLASLAELNVYYRILQSQGMAFPFASVAPFVALLKYLGSALAVGIPVAFILFQFRMSKASFATILCLAGVIAALVFRLLILIEPHHSSRAVAQLLASRSGEGDPIVHAGSLEYSGGLRFYMGRNIYLLNGKRGDLDFGSRYPETKYLYLGDAEFARLWNSGRQVFLVGSEERARKVIEKISIGETFFLGRYGSRLLYVNRRPGGPER